MTPLTALKFAELTARAGFPKGVVNILPGSGRLENLFVISLGWVSIDLFKLILFQQRIIWYISLSVAGNTLPYILNIIWGNHPHFSIIGALVGQRMSDHPDIRKLGFTGSTEIGKHIMKRWEPKIIYTSWSVIFNIDAQPLCVHVVVQLCCQQCEESLPGAGRKIPSYHFQWLWPGQGCTHGTSLQSVVIVSSEINFKVLILAITAIRIMKQPSVSWVQNSLRKSLWFIILINKKKLLTDTSMSTCWITATMSCFFYLWVTEL